MKKIHLSNKNVLSGFVWLWKRKGVIGKYMIKINGKEYAYQEKKLTEFLEEQGYRPEVIAVELNEEMVSRDQFAQTIFHDGDIVEIVTFMGGGAF